MSFSLITAALLIGCYPNENTYYYSDFDIAVTDYDSVFVNADRFADVKNVFLLDTVAHIVDEGEKVNGTYDKVIKNSVLANLKKTSFENVYLVKDSTDVPAGITPDIVVTITSLETDYYTYWSYPWWGYWGGWGWGWYYKSASLKSTDEVANTSYYPYYPYYPYYGGVSYSYTTGSVNISFINYKDISREEGEGTIPVVWTGIINGLSSTSTNASTRIQSEIDQCFSEAQSPYLY